jgi:hypothetical protein
MNANYWDAFAVRDLCDAPQGGHGGQRLFGDRNLGNYLLTNLQVPGQIASDQSLVVCNWYARSNVAEAAQSGALAAAWHAWKHATIATLVVGSRPVMMRPLSDLMGPRDFYGGIGGHDQVEIEGAGRTRIAMAMYKAYRDAQAAAITGPFPGPIEPRNPPHGWETWEDLSETQRKGWLDAVASVRPLYRPYIIPVRQNFSVTIDSDRRALAALLEVLPTNVAPQALVWVHLDGLETRDVA